MDGIGSTEDECAGAGFGKYGGSVVVRNGGEKGGVRRTVVMDDDIGGRCAAQGAAGEAEGFGISLRDEQFALTITLRATNFSSAMAAIAPKPSAISMSHNS
jgi:hypothetical protein